MGPEKIFSDQDFRYLQILVYGIFISFLVIELQKKRYPPRKNGRFYGGAGKLNYHLATWDVACVLKYRMEAIRSWKGDSPRLV